MSVRFLSSLIVLCACHLTVSAQLIAPDPAKYKESVEPLLETSWGQSEPYNSLCPTRTSSDGTEKNCPVGCVALALGQVMKYYNYPETGEGTKSYTTFFGDNLTADFANTHYDWANMKTRYTKFGTYKNYTDEEVEAVATLLYHIGVSVGMLYSLSGSSALAYSNIPKDMVSNFRYDETTIQYVTRSSVDSKEEWMNLIYEELSNGRPIFYTGTSSIQGAHAWVVDGYDSTGRVHINWGWKGSDNGYYDIDLDDTENDFSRAQSMIIGMQPINSSGIEHTTVASADKAVVGIYNIGGVKIPALQKGLNIIKYADGTTRKVMMAE